MTATDPPELGPVSRLQLGCRLTIERAAAGRRNDHGHRPWTPVRDQHEDVSIALDPVYDRGLLLGPKRNVVLDLWEVHRYGVDSFGDPDYASIYGLRPAEWYAKGVRLLGRTVVECTRDLLADAIGGDMAAVAGGASAQSEVILIDPFAGSCNTLFWMLEHLPGSRAIGSEVDGAVFELTKRNLSMLGSSIELIHTDHLTALASVNVPDDAIVVAFIAPPWGAGLSPDGVLDLRRTLPPVGEVLDLVRSRFAGPLVCAIQIYEATEATSLMELAARFNWSAVKSYPLNAPGRNHGILIASRT